MRQHNLAKIVLQVQLGPCIDQGHCVLRVASVRRQHQRSPTSIILQVQLGSDTDQRVGPVPKARGIVFLMHISRRGKHLERRGLLHQIGMGR